MGALILLYTMGKLFLEFSIYEIDFLYAITNMVFAIGLVVISGFATLISEVIAMRKKQVE